jgi:hypothetical protein
MVIRIRMDLYSVKAGLENVKNHGFIKTIKKQKILIFSDLGSAYIYSEMYILCALTSYIYTRIKRAIYHRKNSTKTLCCLNEVAHCNRHYMCTPGYPHMFSLCTYMSL